MSVAKERGPYGFTHPLPTGGVAAQPHKEPRGAGERSRRAGARASDNASYRSQVAGREGWRQVRWWRRGCGCGLFATSCGWLTTDSVSLLY